MTQKNKEMERTIYHCRLGDMLMGSEDGKLCLCRWATDGGLHEAEGTTSTVLEEARRQLDEYFAGTRTAFRLPVEAKGTAFQQRVWSALARIPHGTTMSYARLAASIGSPKAYRAVAQACHANPIAIIIPCHRVIGADGKLTGYAGGLDRKRSLLALEAQDTRPSTYLYI